MNCFEPEVIAAAVNAVQADFGSASPLFISDYELSRRCEVERQKAAGLTGGGPKCPLCDQRALRRDEMKEAYQCSICDTVAEIIVCNGRISVESLVVGDPDKARRYLDRERREVLDALAR